MKVQKQICIITHQHLCRNPRVLKESLALEKIGLGVTILTNVYSKKLLEEDHKLVKNKNIRYLFYNNLTEKNLANYKNRIINKLGRWASQLAIENKWALGYAPAECLKIALTQKANLYICHQELPAYIGTLLLKKGKKVVFDIEDWYSEDLLPQARKYRPQKLLEKTEQTALNLAQLVYTTSIPMAKELAEKYQSKKPEVIYNSFSHFCSSTEKTANTNNIKLIWLSQTIGLGRGLEEFVQSLNMVDNATFELNLRGHVSEEYKAYLMGLLINKKHQINFLPLIPNDEIQKDLINYDIGLATEPNYPLNKDLTISNKIFHYLSVGLPVIASSTKGQLSLQNDFKDSIFYFNNNEELIQILSTIKATKFQEKKEGILSKYQEKYDWDIIEKKLQHIIKNIL